MCSGSVSTHMQAALDCTLQLEQPTRTGAVLQTTACKGARLGGFSGSGLLNPQSYSGWAKTARKRAAHTQGQDVTDRQKLEVQHSWGHWRQSRRQLGARMHRAAAHAVLQSVAGSAGCGRARCRLGRRALVAGCTHISSHQLVVL